MLLVKNSAINFYSSSPSFHHIFMLKDRWSLAGTMFGDVAAASTCQLPLPLQVSLHVSIRRKIRSDATTQPTENNLNFFIPPTS